MKSTGIVIAEVDPTVINPLWQQTEIPVNSKRITGIGWGVIRELVNPLYFRIVANGNQIIPRTGKIQIAALPFAVGYYQMIPCNVELEGPPYNVILETSATGAETGRVAVLLGVNNSNDEEDQIIDDLDKIVKLLGG